MYPSGEQISVHLKNVLPGEAVLVEELLDMIVQDVLLQLSRFGTLLVKNTDQGKKTFLLLGKVHKKVGTSKGETTIIVAEIDYQDPDASLCPVLEKLKIFPEVTFKCEHCRNEQQPPPSMTVFTREELGKAAQKLKR